MWFVWQAARYPQFTLVPYTTMYYVNMLKLIYIEESFYGMPPSCLHRSSSPFPFPDYVLSEHNEILGKPRDEVDNNYNPIPTFVIKVMTKPVVCLRMGIPASPARTPTFTQK